MSQNIFSKFKKLIITIIGMSGFRVERLRLNGEKKFLPLTIIWVLFLAASFLGAWFITEKYHLSGALIYFGVTWVYYYLGNTLILKTNLRFKLINIFGEETAYRIYEVILGLMFANQAMAFGAVVEENWLRWPALEKLTLIDEAGLLLIVIGFVIKTWATMIVGLDTYYYKDMFLKKANGSFAVVGPYKIFNNPMYGIGNLQLYGMALVYFSISGVAFALLLHSSIYAFYYLAEKPAVSKIYGEAV